MALPRRLSFDGFVVIPAEKRLLRPDGSALPLSPRLFGALCLFLEHPGELLDKDTLLRTLWPGLVVEENNLNQLVAALRRALGDDAQRPRLIQTVPRYGFRFVATVQPLPEPVPPETVQAVQAVEAAPAAGAVAAVAGVEAVEPAAAPAAGPASPARRRWLALAAAGIAAAGGAGWWAWRRLARQPVPSLAVLPFRPLGAEGRDELLEIGMADSLGTRLSLLPGLAVRSTASVLRYAGTEQDAQRAARELDVAWIVDGSLQRRGEQWRVTARLLQAADGVAAWSGSFDTRSGSVFEIQDRIAEQVQQALLPVLQRQAAPVPEAGELGGTRNTEAYQLYLAASWRAQDGRPQAIARAIELLQQALALDPAYAQAWTRLAWTHRRRLWNADALPAEVFEASNQALAQALALAPELPQAHAGLGFTRYWFEFDWPGGEAGFRHALQLNANVVEAHHGLAVLLLSQGRLDEGWFHARRARELDPMSPTLNTLEGSYLVDSGQLAEAERRLAIALELNPRVWFAHVAQGLLLLRRQQPEAALDAFRQAAQLGGHLSRPQAVLAEQLALQGHGDEARAILAGLQRQAAAGYVPPSSLAMVHAALGDKGAALDALEQAYRWRDARLIFLKDDPSWRSLRDQPRYVALRRKLRLDGLPPGIIPV